MKRSIRKLRQIAKGYVGVCGVYILQNTRNRKKYVGSGINVYNRLNKHTQSLLRGRHWNLHMKNAWELGQRFELFKVIECSERKLIGLEQFYIDKYKTADKRYGYNLTIAGRTVPSKDGRKRIGDSKRGKTYEELFGEKVAKRRRAELRLQMGGKNNPRYGIRGELHPCFGKTTEELYGKEIADRMRQATSNAHKGKKLSRKQRRIISEYRSGRALSISHKDAIGAGVRRFNDSVGPRSMKEKYGKRTNGVLKNISKGNKRHWAELKRSPKYKAWLERRKEQRRKTIANKALRKAA